MSEDDAALKHSMRAQQSLHEVVHEFSRAVIANIKEGHGYAFVTGVAGGLTISSNYSDQDTVKMLMLAAQQLSDKIAREAAGVQ